jgi:cation transport ATPase
MQDIELKQIWESYNQQLAKAEVLNLQSWALNTRCFETLQQQQAEKKLEKLSGFNRRAIMLGIVWIAFLLLLVWGNCFQNPFFSLSLSAIALLTVYVTAKYVLHNILIGQVRYDTPVTDTQKQLARLQSSTFRSTAVAWWQLPFYTTWFWSSSWIQESGLSFWLIAFPITLLFTLLAFFLYRNIHAGNMHKKWVKTLMMAGPEYNHVAAAMAYLEEIDAFIKDQL